MKVPLTTQTKYVNAIISLKDKSYEKIKGAIMVDLSTFCENYCDMYAYILHDKDKDESGVLQTPHIHLCMLMKTNRQRLSTILSNLSADIGVSQLAISIEKMNDVTGSIQYLVHKNEVNKVKYDISDISTNLKREELDVYMTSQQGSLSIDKLVEICTRAKSRIDIMREIGLGYYHLYRNVIKDICEEIAYYNDKESVPACH